MQKISTDNEVALRNTYANGILVNKSIKYNWFLKGTWYNETTY